MKSSELNLESLKSALRESIDAYCYRAYGDSAPWRLGASKIGHDCKRYLWYLFRWCQIEVLDARMLRLLNRGDREEARFIEMLKGAGCEVWAFDANGKQFAISGCNGHFGGKLDAVIKLPTEFNFDEPLLASFKTNATGKGFAGLFENGLAKHKPTHWAQECTYGYKYGLKYVAYFNINKNDDDLYIEIAELDYKLGAYCEEKAALVIGSQTPPVRISDNPKHKECVYCHFKNICHAGESANKNCRSCKNATPSKIGNSAAWHCGFHNDIIPREFIETLQGCEHWQDITK